ncbi:MAG: DUF4392 domain-containing protein [Planctomycetes bacterium]|nr:DUF4392 domain-containing protein [Planctomycetota bacterium]
MQHQTIEDIVLAHETRNMTALRPFLPHDFVSDAARLVLANRGRALIVTGFYIQRAGAPETDGPPGAAALGGALRALGYDVCYVTDRFSAGAVQAVAGDEPIIEFPVLGHEESRLAAADLLARHRPAVLVSIERPGLLSDGTYRNCAGIDFSDYNARTDYLFTQHPASVGIGDGGNEIGMGLLRDTIARTAGLPDDPSVTRTTRLIIASCSNWGAYGLVAALSLMTNRALLPSVERAHGWVRRIVEAGGVDGLTGERKDWVDGRSPEEDALCLRALHSLLKRSGVAGTPEERAASRPEGPRSGGP